MTSDNLTRLKMELKNIDVPDDELEIYLNENGLDGLEVYEPTSQAAKRKIYLTALSVMESIANDPQRMKSIKKNDMSVTFFHDNLLKRIDQLERKIRMMVHDDNNSDSSTFILFD
jgi:hypothetical protein